MAKPEVDEDCGQASIFINLANRRYIKTVRKSLSVRQKQTDSLLDDVLFWVRYGSLLTGNTTAATVGEAVGR